MPYKQKKCGKGKVRQSVKGKTIAKCTTRAKAAAQRRAIETKKHGRR